MRVALVGPELEENLAVRYIHAAVTEAGHEGRIYDFHCEDQLAQVALRIAAFEPDVVGLSMMFTARSREFVALAERLRELGYRGHITAGGHFASFHAELLLGDCAALDSIVHGEGEEGLCELLAQLDDPSAVTGITWRDASGRIAHTGYRSNLPDLDSRAYPTRPEVFHEYMGMGIASLLAGRGCYANCNFCSINAWHRQSGGPRFRQRSVEAIAHEMAELYHCRNVRIFNFQDDQFFLPTERHNLERLEHLQAELDGHRVGKIALQVKARPDSVTLPVVEQLKRMGLFRVFLGVETNAVVGLETLGRGVQREQNHRALDILRRLEVHTCFNLLIFDPQSEFAALWQNIEFLRRQSYFPLNFCRVEVYAGTAIERRLRDEGRLIGDYYGYTYEIANPRVQLAYEIFREVFSPRNFRVEGMNHQAMRADYYYHLLAHFHPTRATARMGRGVKQLVGELNRNNADLLGEICRFAESGTLSDADVRARTAALSSARIEYDAAMTPRVEALLAGMEELAQAAGRAAQPARSKVTSVAAAALLASTLGCGPKPDTHMAEMAPPDPTYPIAGDMTGEQVTLIQQRIREPAHNERLLEFARTYGVMGQTYEVELSLAADGRIESLRVNANPPISEALRSLLQDVPLAGIVGRGGVASGMIVVTFPRGPETHMAEMAPRDPTYGPKFADPPPPKDPPPPPPPPVQLDYNETIQLQNEIQSQYGSVLLELGKKHGKGVVFVTAAVEFGAKGTIDKAEVSLPQGVKNRRLVRKLTKLMQSWSFAAYGEGRKATVTVYVAPVPAVKVRKDTHMAEMAPRDPTYPGPKAPPEPDN